MSAETSQKTLLVITSSFPRHERDLAGHFVRDWCEALVARGHRVAVLAWRGEGAEDWSQGGLSVRFVPYALPAWETLFFGSGAPENLERRPLRGLLALPALGAMLYAATKKLSEERFDAVVGHWLLPGGLIARLCEALTGVPSFVVGHSGGVHLLERSGMLGERLARWICQGPVTVPSIALRSKLDGRYGVRHLNLAPMGYRPLAGTSLVKCKGNDEVVRLGFLGRLVPIKGLETVLLAMAALHAEGVRVTLDVVGDGPCEGVWHRLGGPNVVFHGARFGAEKERFLASWDGVVVPSRRLSNGRHEGLPVSLLEAAGAGAIVLVSGVPGVEPWLARPEAQLVEEGDIEAWKRAIKTLVGLSLKERRRWQEESRQRVERLAWPVYGAAWEQWLNGGGNQRTIFENFLNEGCSAVRRASKTMVS